MRKTLYNLILIFLITTLFGCQKVEVPTDQAEDIYFNELKDNLQNWGLGNEVISYVSLNRSYDWYIDQYDTGVHSSLNCGPTSVVMAGNFFKPDFNHTAEQARSLYRENGGWWYDDDINQALDYFGVDYYKTVINNIDDLKSIINNNRIILINNDMSKISYNSNNSHRLNKFYSGVTGHYLIVKGYLITDQYTLFEVYDPFTMRKYYSDQLPKGKNRYYEANQLIESILTWYPTVYEIPKYKE